MSCPPLDIPSCHRLHHARTHTLTVAHPPTLTTHTQYAHSTHPMCIHVLFRSHPVVVMALVAIILAFFSTLFEVLHLRAYQAHGQV